MSELPSNWSSSSLGDVSNSITYGFTTASTMGGTRPKLLRITDIQNGEVNWDTVPRCTDAPDDRALLDAGDIVIARTGATTGKSFLIGTVPEKAVFASYLIRVRLGKQVDPRYAWAFMQSNEYWSQIQTVSKGTAQPGANASILSELSLPVPPFPEQRRIVAKIDSLTSKTKRARDHLDHIPRLVEKYKESVLAAAFRGDLTRAWREENAAAAWQSTTLGMVVNIASGQTPKGIEERLSPNGEIPWFKVSSMNEPDNLTGLRTSQFRLSREDAGALGLRIVAAGSITFPKRGGAIATNKKRRLLADGALDLNLMVLTATIISADFLWWWMQKLDLASISNGSNVPQINNGDIAPLPIEVPSPSEQAEIAKRLGTAFSWIDSLASEATSARTLVDRLDQAVLAKAFRGELVPQDPDDEPASELLERTKAECRAAPKAKRGKKAKSA
ncbi:type I restriction enzyme S subunit [Rhizobium laguerreae]|uniref:Type I restriction enzyme S subunit n=1 Tax=Rhizobium laguerreae TaxID=1076926 RepID=A0ABR6GEF2_9HYPH|nr:restriction endonuclease subunit S [Rhizobium laguerreae]MBB3164659.1 type I restriction enzyme S subunit [Rhizobium laguerreae]OOO46425.1 hypothetical protein BS630_25575 [Rhizobium laguerreae]